jgi:hypothetical protein
MGWPKGKPRKGYVVGTLKAERASNPAPSNVLRMSPSSSSSVVLKATPKKTYSPYEEVGRTGLKQVGGFLQEEFLNDLRGQKGAKIYREMVDNNADLGAFMTLVKRLLQQVKWRFEPVSSKAADVEKAEWFDGALGDMEHSWPETLSEILSMLQYGFAPMEVTLKARRGWSKDVTKRSKFDDGMIGWRKFSLRSQESVWRWIYDEDQRELVSMIQLPPPLYSQIEIPMDKILNFRPDVERDNPEGRSPLRSAYWDYYWYKRLVAIAAIGAERDLNGIPVMSIPADCMRADASDAEKAVHTRARQIVENLRVDEQAGIVLPLQFDPETKQPLFKLELLSAGGGKGKVDIDAMLKRHQTNMLRAVLSDWMMLGTGDTGSWSLSSDRTDQFAVVLGGIMDVICGVMNRQAVPALARLNGWDLNELPEMQHGDVESPDLQKLADFVSKAMAAGAITPDGELEDYLREAAHLPARLESDEDTGVETQPRMPATPPTSPQEPPEEDEEGEEEAPEPAPDQAKKRAGQPRARRGTFAPGAGAEALSLLRDRQRIGSGDTIAHGFKVADTVPFSLNREMTSEVEKAPVQSVELKGLLATQPWVKRSQVRAFIENPGLVMHGQRSMSGTLEDLPVIVQHGGQRFIQDGHHRLAAKRLAGQTVTMARVVDLGDKVQKTPPWHIVHRDGKWLVIGTENDKVYGTHPTEQAAVAHMRALYANVPDAAKKSQEGQQAGEPAPETQAVHTQEET